MIKDSSPKYRDLMVNILIFIIILNFFTPFTGIAVESKQESVEISWRKFYYHFIRNEVVKGSVKNKDNHVTGELLLETGSIFFFIPSHIQHSYKDKRNGYYDGASSYAILLSEEHSDVEREKARKWLKEYTGQIFNSNDEWEDWYGTYKNYLSSDGLRIYKVSAEHYWSRLVSGRIRESKEDGKGNLIVLIVDDMHFSSYYIVSKEEIYQPGAKEKGIASFLEEFSKELDFHVYGRHEFAQEYLKKITGVEFKSKKEFDDWFQVNRTFIKYSEKHKKLFFEKPASGKDK